MLPLELDSSTNNLSVVIDIIIIILYFFLVWGHRMPYEIVGKSFNFSNERQYRPKKDYASTKINMQSCSLFQNCNAILDGITYCNSAEAKIEIMK